VFVDGTNVASVSIDRFNGYFKNPSHLLIGAVNVGGKDGCGKNLSNYYNNLAAFLDGKVDDLKIFRRAFSADEVAALYKYESAPPDNSFITNGLVAYYPFDGDLGDASGNRNDGVAVGTKPSYGVESNTRRGLILDGNQLIQVPNPLLNILGPLAGGAVECTVNSWVKIGANNRNDTMFLGAWGNGIGEINIRKGTFLGNPNSILINFPKVQTGCAIPNFEYNKWFHLSVTWKSYGKIKVYIDGQFCGDADAQGANLDPLSGFQGVGTPPKIFEIGGLTDSSRLIGAVDQVRIYNRALSAGEVAALYEYESVPQKTDPRQATATATVVNGFVVGATITDAGSGYTKAPKVVISGGGGTGATATATIDANGAVSGIKIVTSGSGYTGIPTIIIDPPPFPPSQAKGTSTLINGFVTGVNITDTGHGYEGVVPPVTFLGGGGSGAKGTAIVSNGMVTGISMTASGSGYTNAPYVLIAAPPGLASADIAVKTVEVTLHLIPGYTYKIQTTTDAGTTWIDVETGILAVDKTLIRSFDVTTNTQLFRVVQVN
jgi:hypothetical protein